MPVVKLSEETASRVTRVFKNMINQRIMATDRTVNEMAEKASWNFKIKSLLDKLEKKD